MEVPCTVMVVILFLCQKYTILWCLLPDFPIKARLPWCLLSHVALRASVLWCLLSHFVLRATVLWCLLSHFALRASVSMSVLPLKHLQLPYYDVCYPVSLSELPYCDVGYLVFLSLRCTLYCDGYYQGLNVWQTAMAVILFLGYTHHSLISVNPFFCKTYCTMTTVSGLHAPLSHIG